MNHTPQQREAHLKIVLKRKRDQERQRVLDAADQFAKEAAEMWRLDWHHAQGAA